MEMLEPISVDIPVNVKETCPFCGEAAHDFPKKKDVDLKKVKSIPKNLGDGVGSLDPQKGKYARARHHLVPVHQCYTVVARLAQMAESVGYNINGTQNGIPLPTVWNKYEVDGKKVNFGKLKEEQKDVIRNGVMKETGAQWHVGNHAYTMPEKEDTTEDMSDEGELDHQPYDMEVISELMAIGDKCYSDGLCKDDSQNNVKDMLDELCGEIREHLDDFADNPKKSAPYYVSVAALKFKTES